MLNWQFHYRFFLSFFSSISLFSCFGISVFLLGYRIYIYILLSFPFYGKSWLHKHYWILITFVIYMIHENSLDNLHILYTHNFHILNIGLNFVSGYALSRFVHTVYNVFSSFWLWRWFGLNVYTRYLMIYLG